MDTRSGCFGRPPSFPTPHTLSAKSEFDNSGHEQCGLLSLSLDTSNMSTLNFMVHDQKQMHIKGSRTCISPAVHQGVLQCSKA